MEDNELKDLEEKLASKQSGRNYNFFRPVGQFIEHVETINFSMDKDGKFHFENVGQVNGEIPNHEDSKQDIRDEELCHFIHPSVDDEQGWKYHDEIKRLVRHQGMQEICQYLKGMSADKIILLPQNVEKAYEELRRMGMPETDGHSFKTFQRYYKK